jgi:hypothetical protein
VTSTLACGDNFFDEGLGEFKGHHQFVEVRPGEGQIPLFELLFGPECSLATLQEPGLPAIEFMGRHFGLTGDPGQAFPAEESEDSFEPSQKAPALGKLWQCGSGFWGIRPIGFLPIGTLLCSSL